METDDERLSRIRDLAIDVFGSLSAAQQFMDEPCMALDHQRPIELVETSEGAKLVEVHLIRLDHGVYT